MIERLAFLFSFFNMTLYYSNIKYFFYVYNYVNFFHTLNLKILALPLCISKIAFFILLMCWCCNKYPCLTIVSWVEIGQGRCTKVQVGAQLWLNVNRTHGLWACGDRMPMNYFKGKLNVCTYRGWEFLD